MKALTSEQNLAITSPLSLAVIASAGTGKTTVLTERFLHCHRERGVPLNRILAFTFTEKAAREMKERILANGRIPLSSLPFLRVSTFHAFCARLLRQHGGHLGLGSDFELLEEKAAAILAQAELKAHLQKRLTDADPLYTEAYARLGYKTLFNLFYSLEKYDLAAQDAQTLRLHPDAPQRDFFDPLLKEARAWQVQSLDLRLTRQTLTFNDLETLTLKLLRTHPHILEGLQRLYPHMLVDEFQDLSQTQFDLVTLLFAPARNTLFIVGDPKQSIYAFRRADSRLFFAMQDHILKNGGQSLTLKHTFRTPIRLQEAFNQIFPKLLNSERPDFFTKAVAQTDIANARLCHVDLSEQTNDPLDALIRVVLDLRASGVKWQDIAVLSVSRTQFRDILDAFYKNKIPAVYEDERDALDDPLVSLVVKVFKLLNDNTDRLSFTGILQNPILNLPENVVRTALADFHPSTFTKVSNNEQASRLDTLFSCWQNWIEVRDKLTPKNLAELILRDLGAFASSFAADAFEHFLKTLLSWQKQGILTLSETLPLIALVEAEKLPMSSSLPNETGVRLFTIHGAKGLEFPHVLLWPGSQKPGNRQPFLFDTREGFFFKTPCTWDYPTLNYALEADENFDVLKMAQKSEAREELMRLMYVALTRAQISLCAFAPEASKTLSKHLQKNPQDTTLLKTYNEVLYWLSLQPESKPWSHPEPAETQATEITTTPSAPVSKQNRHAQTSKPLWTVTELETFAECPRFYEYRYLKGWKLPELHLSTSKTGSFAGLTGAQKGDFLHEVFQFYSPSRNNLRDVVEQALFNRHLQTDVEPLLQATNALLLDLQQQPEVWQPLYENEASQTEAGFICSLPSLRISGQIDRLVQFKKMWMVVDYKTHAFANPAEQAALSQRFAFQLKCYALAVAQHYKQNSVAALLVFTNGPSFTPFEFSKDELTAFAKELEELSAKFDAASFKRPFPHTNTLARCASCAYKISETCDVGK